jgi:uncharacterized membrane protein required for colicin V production
MNALNNLPVNWFDIVVVIVVLLGARKGRMNGMSQEMTVCLQWMCIVAAGCFLYQPVGDFIYQECPVSHLFGYITAYIAIAMVVKVAFSLLKKASGGKVASSDTFGRGEYYLGTVAGAVRFICILIAALALLNARSYSHKEVASDIAFQNDVYGSTFFPQLYSVQGCVFKESFIGKQLHENAGFLLIKATAPEKRDVQRRKDELP